MAKFVVMKHQAKKAGLHFDLRFQKPGKNVYDSFAIRKGVPLEPGNKVVAIRTTEHTPSEAMFTGEIKIGYGAGTLEIYDTGTVDVIKYHSNHIVLDLHGAKVNGIYHMIQFPGMKDRKMFLIFKGKLKGKEVENEL